LGRLRVAVHAVDFAAAYRLEPGGREAGHLAVGAQDTADVVLVDGDCPPGEIRRSSRSEARITTCPACLSRDAGASQIDAAIRAVSAA